MASAAEVKLLTLLNVSAVKRPRELDLPGGFRSPATSRPQSQSGSPAPNSEPQPKRRRSVVFGGEVGPSGSAYGNKRSKKGSKLTVAEELENGDENGNENGDENGDAEVDDDEETAEVEIDSDDEDEDAFLTHFGPEPKLLYGDVDLVGAAEEGRWETSRASVSGLGRVVEQRPVGGSRAEGKARLVPTIAKAMKASPALASTLLSHLGAYSDLYAHSMDGEADGSESAPFAAGTHDALRAAAAAHAMNHVLKNRRRIVRGNERLAHAAAEGKVIEEPRDGSFTRPKVLILLPTRAAALKWVTQYLFPLSGEGTQIENRRPFLESFGLPEGVEDPLTTGDWPADHLENFRGNTDDNFRFALKITRKAWRVVMPPTNEAKLNDSDIIIASPLAIKMGAERERTTDYLSSIEVCVVDGADVMAMQNWDHVQFVFKHLSEVAAQSHNTDITRLKLWYAEEKAKYLRQTVLLSRYDMPETRGLFHHACHNVAGKVRVDAAAGLKGVLDRVRSGVRQVFERFDAEEKALGAEAGVEEVDKRLEWFTKKTIPALLRAAGSRTQTLVVVPSYFDFVRVTNHLRKTGTVTYAALSEYSSNSEISRARTQFFKGKRAFLIVTERFHFYRRYRLRGARTLVFYSLPEHAAFYAEFLAMPFVAARGAGEVDEDVDPADVRAHTLFSRFDVLRLERVVGHTDARKMLASGETRFEFI
ncbi:hypothetical protein CspHIS471_0313360 [Cutaneotrichosporon sp. HIS471]|nr:hypothetical protein CspHIS471_0313360 [Cutaneotrichosporon sp. HIS471]